MIAQEKFPTSKHYVAATALAGFFGDQQDVDTVLVTNSIARGKAVASSDIDIAVLVKPQADSARIETLAAHWQRFKAQEPAIQAYLQSSRHAQIHLDIITGEYNFERWDDGGGPDYYEVEIGNHLVYSAPFLEPGAHFLALQARFLPYYAEADRQLRLQDCVLGARNDLEFVPIYFERGQYFQAFDRLYKAYQEFLQALFITRKTYPIAYNKWIDEQLIEILGLPALYEAVQTIFAVPRVDSPLVVERAGALRTLLDHYVDCSEA